MSFVKERLFSKNDKTLSNAKATIRKVREKHIKTVNEQKKYVRARSTTGNDFILMVFSLIFFYAGFVYMIYPRLETLRAGIISVLIFGIAFAFVFAKFISNSKVLWYTFITATLNYMYAGYLLIFIKFFDTISNILLIITSIAILILTSYILSKIWRDTNGQDRKA